MKAGLISVQPYWCYLEWLGQKTTEIRKTRPREGVKDWYVYCTKKESDLKKIPIEHREMVWSWFGKIPFKFTLQEKPYGGYLISPFGDFVLKPARLTEEEVKVYSPDKPVFAWHISNLKEFDTPKELKEFYKSCNDNCLGECSLCLRGIVTHPPQSFMYVEVSE